MIDLFLQIVLPFIFSALIVILITIIAEKYGTKIGGIIGTLPSTIIIAYVFIALNQGIIFASDSVAVVPAEMGVNLVFICIFAILAYNSTAVAFFGSFFIWIILSGLLLFLNMHNIYLSILLFIVSMFFTFIVLEKKYKIKSQGKKIVHYTPMKILFRGILTGLIITISVLLSNIGEVLSGIFTVFPAILSSTMYITVKEHGPNFSAGIAKSMIFGSPSVMSYATSVHFLYPIYGIFWGSIFAFIISIIISLIIFKLRNKIS
jgi:uncharacterized membrane protein (GlpM family)